MNSDRAVLVVAQELFEKLSDVDDNTAHVALEVAKQLLIHRQMAHIEFERSTSLVDRQSQYGEQS